MRSTLHPPLTHRLAACALRQALVNGDCPSCTRSSVILDFMPLPPSKLSSPPPRPSIFSYEVQAQITASLDVEAERLAFELDAEAPLVGDTIKRHHTNTNSAELYFLFHVRSCAASACGATSDTSNPAAQPGGSLPTWLSSTLRVVASGVERALSFCLVFFSWIACILLVLPCLYVCVFVHLAYLSFLWLVFVGADYLFIPLIALSVDPVGASYDFLLSYS